MKKLLCLKLAIVPAITLIVGCTSFGHRDGSLRDSALSNQNPAPPQMSPPNAPEGSSPVMDDAYLSSQADYHFTMGETLAYEGQGARAIEEFKTTLIYDPKSVHVRLRLAAEYVRQGNLTEAVEQAEIAVEMAPASVESHMMLGGLYSGLKMYEPARTQFGEVLKLKPGHAEAAVYMGALLAEQKLYDESIKYFQALAHDSTFQDPEKAYYYIGRVRSEQGADFYAEAEKAFGKALDMKPEYPEAANALAMLLRAQGKEKQMEILLKSYQEKFGPDHEMARQLSQFYLQKENYEKALEQLEVVDGFERDNLNIKIQIALIMIEGRKYEQAAVRLEDVLLQAPESDKVRYYLGAVYEEIKKSELALMHYKKIPSGSPYYAEAVVHTAHLQKAAGKMEQAIATIEGAIKQQDDIPQLYAYYATLLDDTKAYKRAVKMLTSAVEKFPSNTQLRFFLGTMHDRTGNIDLTIAEMNKVLELDPDHVQAMNYLAYTYAELGKNLDDATALSTRALSLQPGDGYIMDTIGWIHFKRGQIEDAIKYLEAAHKLKQDEAIIAEHLGDAYLRHEMWQKAQKMYQKAAKLEKDEKNSRKIQDKIANVQMQIQTTPPKRVPASVPAK